jgi:hypothetical protein
MRLNAADILLDQMLDIWIHGVKRRTELIRQLYAHRFESPSVDRLVSIPGPFLRDIARRLQQTPTDVYLLSISPHIIHLFSFKGCVFLMVFNGSTLVEIRSVPTP